MHTHGVKVLLEISLLLDIYMVLLQLEEILDVLECFHGLVGGRQELGEVLMYV